MAKAPELQQEFRHLGDGGPRRSTRSLVPQGSGSLWVSIMKEAWEEAGHSHNDPGDVAQWYYPEKDMIVIDLDP